MAAHPTPERLAHLVPTAPGWLMGVADAGWVVRQVSEDDQGLVGPPSTHLAGSSLLDHVHSGDVADLRWASAQAVDTRHPATVVVNLGHPGAWRPVRVVVSPMHDEVDEVGFIIQELDGGADERVTVLEQHLLRIARELETAQVPVGGAERSLEAAVGAADLSPRQWEVLRRLVRGQRVPRIARDLYLSASTVRNHLTAIFAKLGVHSQEELIERLRADGDDQRASA